MRYPIGTSAFLFVIVGTLSAGEIGFVEDFALATDRAAVLQQLVPGTEDFYYYHALHALNTEQYDKIAGLMAPWVQKHGETPRVREIQTRFALLTYDKAPEKSLDYLRRRLNLTYPHQRQLLDADPRLPVALDPNQITREAFIDRAQSIAPETIDQYEDSAIEWLVTWQLTPKQRRSLLTRMHRPDYEPLVKKIVDDLQFEHAGPFGSLPIHRQLLLSQLEEIANQKPDLLQQQAFVTAWLIRLQPTADVDWRSDVTARTAFLDRLWAFAAKLAPVHNSLKAHVLYHRLLLDRERGQFDKARFLEYLKLPRQIGYVSKQMLESDALRRFACNLNENYGGATQHAPIGNDEPLVRSLLAHFLVDARDAKEFEPYINDVYLRELFAEVKITHGLGEPEQWAALLSPAKFQQLKDRVDIDFAATNAKHFAADDPVALDLQLKNVRTLLVKVFEINTQTYYRTTLKEVDTDINLDGLVANIEQSHELQESPFQRITKRFEFPQLARPGVYVIDFIGNGRSSRALIRKGNLKHLVRTLSAGQVFTVLDDRQHVVKDAKLWLGGHEYTADKNGAITVPFSTAPGRHPVVLTSGPLSTLAHFDHEGEQYALQAGLYVDREALLKRKTAALMVRAGLTVNGTPIALSNLEDVKLTIRSTDLDGIAASQETPKFPLFEDRETIHEFQVPDRLASIEFTLTGKVKQLTTGGNKTDLSVSEQFTLNGIDKTERTDRVHLVETAEGVFVELRGKTGEAKVARPVQVQIKHRDFKTPYTVALQTDASGRIALGRLTNMESVTAAGPQGGSQTWRLHQDQSTYPATLHGHVGVPLTLPYLPHAGSSDPTRRTELSLLEVRGDTFVADRFEHLRIENDLIVIDKLPVGDYELWCKATPTKIRIRITAGERNGRFVLSSYRQLELPSLPPLQIASLTINSKPAKPDVDPPAAMLLRIVNATKFTRVHLIATRFAPEYDVFATLSEVRGPEPYWFQRSQSLSAYLTGRNIGDEYRYIIDRRYARKFPGNSLDRPSLLLNPWAVRETQTGAQVAAGGDTFAAAAPKSQSAGGRMPTSESKLSLVVSPDGANLNFLAHEAVVLPNLVPDADGMIKIDPALLNEKTQLHVIAVDPVATVHRRFLLPDTPAAFSDQRLLVGLDPQAHFTQQKQITVVPAGQTFQLRDITTSKFEVLDSLARVYGLFATLNSDPQLAEFAFLLNWPNLKDTEKRTLYSKHASHELSFFLFKKDPEFFRSVVLPYLANKKDKTFLDRYLLSDDLAEYRDPWKHAQLNIAERVLLAQRLQDERPQTARHVRDLYALLPPNRDRFNQLFDTAVQRSSLSTEDVFEFGLRQRLSEEDKASLSAAPPANLQSHTVRNRTIMAPEPADRPAPKFAAEKQAEARKKMDAKDGATSLSRRSALGDVDAAASDKSASGDAVDRFGTNVYHDLDGSGIEGERLKRESMRQLFRQLDKTREWAENNYSHLTIEQQTADLIPVNAFWRDYAAHDPAAPFLSPHLAEASRNFPEMLLALALLDLPFASPKHDTQYDGPQMTLKAGGPLVVFHEEIRAAAKPANAAAVLVTQHFFKHGDRHRTENGEAVEKRVTEEFLVQTVYGCQVVVTNPTSSRQKLNVLVQIPQGAVPVLNSRETKTVTLTLEPYHTEAFDYHFYFPVAGSYPHFPVHVAREEALIAVAEPSTLNVVDKATKIDTESWEYVSQQGSNDDVLAFLDRHNVHSLPLDRIAWRMRDPKLFAEVITRLKPRHAYNHTLWSYSLMHNIAPAAREFLQHADLIVNETGGRLRSTLLVVDPVARRAYEHLEYKPLVNSRAHALGQRRQIVNDRLLTQYDKTLHELCYERQLSDEDRLSATYYMLLQDRVEEALALCSQVNPERIATRMQYDYCAAYVAFFGDDPNRARAIAAKYVDHPVDRWRNAFAEITSQLDEAQGKADPAAPRSPEERTQQQTQLAATEPGFDFSVEKKQIQLQYQNLKTVQIHFYEMDVELLFSRNPFTQQFGSQFSSIRPNLALAVELPADRRNLEIPLPKEFDGRNVLVEIVGAGKSRSLPYYAHSLGVQVIENYGQVKVTQQATGQPIPKAYIKVYGRMQNGEVKFYKDGYTDIRGRFDYASLNTDDLDTATRFAVLILTEDQGAVVREASPPLR